MDAHDEVRQTFVEWFRDANREHGFGAVEGVFRWDTPDLRVDVRDDFAVARGLNRMRSEVPGERAVETWSRGTRVFQHIDGEWKLIHQHVSFAVDPETAAARTDLEP